MTGVVFPSHFEAALLLGKLEDKVPARLSRDLPTWLAKRGARDVAVGVIGMGPPHCARRAEQFLDHYEVERLVLAGFAGALDPALKRGEVILNRGEGKVHTVNEIVATAEDKARLLKQTGSPIADMESAHLTALAQRRDVPLTVIRAVSDLAGEDVPVDILERSYDSARGVTTPLRLGLHLAAHWNDIRRLVAFLRPLSAVRRRLTQVVLTEIE